MELAGRAANEPLEFDEDAALFFAPVLAELEGKQTTV